MSDQYMSTDGFRPLKLPRTGEELLSGRQYYLNPIARATIRDVYGFGDIPCVVECLLAKRKKTLVETNTYDLTGEEPRLIHSHKEIFNEQHATFRAFIKHKRHRIFTLDLDAMSELAPFYADADKVKDFEATDYVMKKGGSAKAAKSIDLSILDL